MFFEVYRLLKCITYISLLSFFFQKSVALNKIFQRKRGIQDTKTCRKCKLQGICAELENKVLLQTILDRRLKVNIRD